MAKVSQHLWFEKDMESAVRFYTTIIPGSSMQWITAIPADMPSGPAGSVKIAALTIGDQRYMAIEAGPLDATPGISGRAATTTQGARSSVEPRAQALTATLSRACRSLQPPYCTQKGPPNRRRS